MLYQIRDILLSIIVLACFFWLFIFIMIALFLSQKKVFFVQERTGYQARPFRLIKFSTLRDAAPGVPEEQDQKARLTAVGRILRRLSLDELPQLFNVIGGSMSLVGPRPLLHEYLPLYSEEDKGRFRVRPGITGWAQVRGRNAIPFKERFRLDNWYIEHRSFWLDIRILWYTFLNIFRGRDVYVDERTTAYKFDGTN